jgi:hypothetical protein
VETHHLLFSGVWKMVRLKLILEENEYSALFKVPESELRDPTNQLHFILRQDLERRGLLPPEEPRQPSKISLCKEDQKS